MKCNKLPDSVSVQIICFLFKMKKITYLEIGHFDSLHFTKLISFNQYLIDSVQIPGDRYRMPISISTHAHGPVGSKQIIRSYSAGDPVTLC